VANALLAYEFGTLLVLVVLVAWIAAWIAGAIDVIRRHDLTGGSKALWLIVLLVFPLIGLFVYYGFSSRPTR
jgi:Phospholipase_D-nuclease N-terminal